MHPTTAPPFYQPLLALLQTEYQGDPGRLATALHEVRDYLLTDHDTSAPGSAEPLRRVLHTLNGLVQAFGGGTQPR